MSTPANPLKAAMQAVQQPPSPALAALPSPASPPVRALAPSRRNKRAIGGHFDPAVGKQLRLLSVDLDRTVQDLLAEALNDLFRKYNKSAIATP